VSNLELLHADSSGGKMVEGEILGSGGIGRP
jgi:hypothetical protein